MGLLTTRLPDRLNRFVLRWATRRSLTYRVWFALGAIGISTALRFAVHDVLPTGFPFVTFFPAIILTAFFAGAVAGAGVAVVTGLISWYWFILPTGSLALSPSALLALLFFVFIAITDILLIHLMTEALHRTAKAEARSSALAHARSLMFHELQHRVSNNISTLGALLRLQERRLVDPRARAALADARARLEVVARLQRRLHDPARQSVDLGDYIRGLAADTIEAMDAGTRIACRFELEPFRSEPDQAMPLGLVTSELLMNACEHGFAGGASGTILIRLSVAHGGALLVIEDDGAGLPEGFSNRASTSLGLSIARQFAEQIGGQLVVGARSGGGSRCELSFPVRMPGSAEAEPLTAA
ncbi:sensor histidine kinase [Cereibacter azotoformans]|uniref:histidine kinase n=1 Tax=Cereibacter azotoformans TaxID=43057 RepID=A0A2T5KA82_9RHOB|nr:sensor histidine kinase [Cereibacter azotoformans]AXQ95276.1 sensor histidine kinase [Cereibacter sphaeroides]PTR19299.1 two-component sensor histidine kinase [Cereibacter azotoformans]UIJ32505.1 sensor histidine kinase [Cereibacter azotoformans]